MTCSVWHPQSSRRTRYLPTRTTMIRNFSVSPSGAVNSAEAADTTDAADSGHAGNPTDAAASVTSIVSDTTSDTSEAGGNAAPVLIFPNPSAPLFTQRDATELSHADHLLFGCGPDTRAMTRESLSITARRASTYANTRSATTC